MDIYIHKVKNSNLADVAKNSIVEHAERAKGEGYSGIKAHLAETAHAAYRLPDSPEKEELMEIMLDALRRILECDHYWRDPVARFSNNLHLFYSARLNSILGADVISVDHPKYDEAIEWLKNYDRKDIDEKNMCATFALNATLGENLDESVKTFVGLLQAFDGHYKFAYPGGKEEQQQMISQLKTLVYDDEDF